MERALTRRLLMTVATVFVTGAALALPAAAAPQKLTVDKGKPTCSDVSGKPYCHIQAAIDDATPGATIEVKNGTYVEQLTIATSLTLHGEDGKTVVKAPAVLTVDSQGKKNVIEVGNGATVKIDHLVISGPGPSSCGSIDSGIAIIGGATVDADHVAVDDIRDNPFSGCQNGEGIRAGTQRYSSIPEVGHLVADHVTVSGYNKNGIVISGTNSTGDLSHNVTVTSNHAIASNGIEVIDGASATIDHNTVAGNQCNLPAPICGPGYDTSAGVLLVGAGAGTLVAQNDVQGNDIGIYTDSPATILDNHLKQDRYWGIYADSGSDGVVVSHNHVDGTSADYGIYTLAQSGMFDHNDARHATVFDLWWDGTGSPTFKDNRCDTAFPSASAWDCT